MKNTLVYRGITFFKIVENEHWSNLQNCAELTQLVLVKKSAQPIKTLTKHIVQMKTMT